MEPDTITCEEIGCVEGYKPIVFAKDQPEYNPLPALTDGHTVITKWKLSDKEIKDIFDNRVVYLKILTFGRPLQPILMTTKVEEL